ncbi:MAG: radical SAM family heme chaperone HemW [Planctomycetota bacterium]
MAQIAPRPAPQRPRSLYLHVPFCFHKCHYCDFYSIVDRQDRQPAFTARLIEELDALAPFAGPLETIFVGGGTPTLLAPDLWKTLLGALHTRFELSEDTEFTVEANPETVTPEIADVLAAGGVNRVSIGAQSFNPRHLATLERWHNPDNVERAIELVRAAGIARQSLDLIFAIPGQSVEDWTEDLDRALGLGATHLSAYNLTYEPATAMTARLHKGEFEPIDEELEVDMLDALIEHTEAQGLGRYEVSNFADNGDECAHNLAYWRQDDWLAAGPSASGHFDGFRWKNTPRLADYLAGSDRGFPTATDVEAPDPRRALCERVMTGLRLCEGLDLADLLRRAEPLGAAARLNAAVGRLQTEGLTRPDVDRLRLNREGLLRADGLAADVMNAIDP